MGGGERRLKNCGVGGRLKNGGGCLKMWGLG